MISVNFVNAGGIHVVKGIFKYRSPEPESMAMYYVGVLTMPYRDFSLQINTESVEVGPTGGREAAVALIRNEKPSKSQEPIPVKSADERFNLMRSSQIRRIPADNEAYDAAFPSHPLSKVWMLQARILASLTVADVVKNSKPHRRESE